MVKILIIFIMVLTSISTASADVIGWHWYNEPVLVKNKKKDPLMHVFNQLTPMQQLSILQMATKQLRARAVLSGKVTDIAAYKQAQDMWVNKATHFSVGWEKMLLLRPDLNYSLQYAHENSLAPVMAQSLHSRERVAIKKIAKNKGLILFYRGKNTGDLMFTKIVKKFCRLYRIALIAVSIDSLSHGREKATALGIHYFPSLVLINPKTGAHRVVSYGFKVESELEQRLLDISDGWKPNF